MEHVALFGCPRSGTSWLGQIFNSAPEVAYRYQPLFAYEFKDWFGRHGLSEASLAAFHAALREARSEFVLQELHPPKGRLTHLVWKEVRFHQLITPLLELQGLQRLVYLFRPPVDMINSWYQAPKEFRAGQDIHAEYLHAPSKNTDPSEFNGLAKWKLSLRIALAAARRHPRRVRLVAYDALRSDPLGTAHALFSWMGLPVGPQTEAFIAASTSRQDPDAYSVFRAQRSALTLPADIVARIHADSEAQELLAQAEAQAWAAQAVSA